MRIDINGFPFEVEITDDVEKLQLDSDDCSENVCSLGVTNFLPLRIYIRKDMHEFNQRNTIIHELVHAYVFCVGVTPDSEEDWCNFFASYGEQILTASKKIYNELVVKGSKAKE